MSARDAAIPPARALGVDQAFRLATALHRGGRLMEAERVYRGILQLRPRHFGSLHQLGMIRRALGALEEGESLLRRASAVEPTSAPARNHLGMALAGLGRVDEAIVEFRAAVALDPTEGWSLNNLGTALLDGGRPTEALEAFEAASRLVPELAEAYDNQGAALTALNRPAEALARHRTALSLKPEFARARCHLGMALATLGRFDEAIVEYRAALAVAPADPEAQANLGAALFAAGRAEEAIAPYREALRLERSAEAHNGLGAALAALQRPREAIAEFERALALEPEHRDARNNLGFALASEGRHAEAISHYARVLERNPDLPATLAHLGASLQALDRAEAALPCLEKALAHGSDLPEVQHIAGHALLALGRLDEARLAFRRAIALSPRSPQFYRALGECGKFAADDPDLVGLMALADDADRCPEPQRIELNFALAKAFDDLGRHEDSFRLLLEGNALQRRRFPYDEEQAIGGMRRIEADFTPELMHRFAGRGHPSEAPIFIVGMPRSGTTLVEQILASHPSVFGAGELPLLAELVNGRLEGTPALLSNGPRGMDGASLDALGARYVAAVRALANGAARITDKMPANYKMIAIIRLAMPRARVIHVRRDPIDTCFSNFSKLFAKGQRYANDLGELGRYYRAYASLMAHWRDLLPAGEMLEVRYEDLVADFEPQARRIVGHCGLDWDPRCLAFHQTRRSVRTASAAQVRRPLYADSVGRSKPYRSLLGPLLAALDGAAAPPVSPVRVGSERTAISVVDPAATPNLDIRAAHEDENTENAR